MYHNTHITFREVGSTLITKWPTYYDEAQVIMVRSLLHFFVLISDLYI